MAIAATDLYVSQWPEENWLAYFWAVINDGADRIEALQQLSKIVIPRPADWSEAAVRQASRRPHLRIAGCIGCYTQARRLYWHHVIWVAHGGSANGRNLVPLCLRWGTIYMTPSQPWHSPNGLCQGDEVKAWNCRDV